MSQWLWWTCQPSCFDFQINISFVKEFVLLESFFFKRIVLSQKSFWLLKVLLKNLYQLLGAIFLFLNWLFCLNNKAHKRKILCKLICKICILFYYFYVNVINVCFFKISHWSFESSLFIFASYSIFEIRWHSLFSHSPHQNPFTNVTNLQHIKIWTPC